MPLVEIGGDAQEPRWGLEAGAVGVPSFPSALGGDDMQRGLPVESARSCAIEGVEQRLPPHLPEKISRNPLRHRGSFQSPASAPVGRLRRRLR
jgi:hypothetical protein